MNIQPHWFYYTTVLKLAKDNGALHRTKMLEMSAKVWGITPDEFDYENDRGTNIFESRIGWAVTDMVGVGAMERTTRGVVDITPFGLSLLDRFPNGLTRKEAEALPEWDTWKQRWTKKDNKSGTPSRVTTPNQDLTPDERLDQALDELNESLARDLVQKIQGLKPIAMERIVLQLLHAMGYGADEEALEHLGGAGDEGVDGVINLDQLGLQKIYVQAKRYKDGSSITPSTIQAFIGALDSKRAVGGVFITTSDFTKAAEEAATKSSRQLKLINGAELGELLIKYKVGIRPREISRSDLDETFFEELDS